MTLANSAVVCNGKIYLAWRQVRHAIFTVVYYRLLTLLYGRFAYDIFALEYALCGVGVMLHAKLVFHLCENEERERTKDQW